MSELDIKKDVCMVGLDTSAPCYYRVMMPAMRLKCDWVGIQGYPPKLHWTTGDVGGDSKLPDFIDDYKIVVLQQPAGESWEKMITALQEHGKKVVFEIDDYLHDIKKREDHGFQQSYDARALVLYERCMRMCDAVICSTDFIARKYKKFNENIYVCRNGIDLNRYKLTRPARDTINIGWAGATGHQKAIMPWLNQIYALMNSHEELCFISIGAPMAEALSPTYGEERAIKIPWTAIEQYPAAMTMFDIALAPAGSGGWYRGKSDLRWLEAAALGIPIIANPKVYPEIEHGVTGFHAVGPHEMVESLMGLIGDKTLRETVGQQAKEYVEEHRSMDLMTEQWADAFRAIAG